MLDRVDSKAAEAFLGHHRIAVVGVSADPKKFGNVVYRELVARGYDPLPVNPARPTIDGVIAHPDLASIPGDIDGVIVMTPASASADVVRECVARGVPRVWLFRGIGGPGAVDDEAVSLCAHHDIPVIIGACPLMFLDHAGFVHRLHRRVRRLRGTVAA